MSDARWEGLDAASLARRLALPRVVIRYQVTSTMDLAHAYGAAGAPAGTLILADAQETGRGRSGRRWISSPGVGIWLTLLARPASVSALGVLSIRAGLALAQTLDDCAHDRVRVKWPNDLYVGNGKIAGVLIESRWREERVEWVAIGCGINVLEAPVPGAAALRHGVSRLEVLDLAVKALCRAAAATGPLRPEELEHWRSRDLALGREVREPIAGRVAGLDAEGALLVHDSSGITRCASGSLVLVEGG